MRAHSPTAYESAACSAASARRGCNPYCCGDSSRTRPWSSAVRRPDPLRRSIRSARQEQAADFSAEPRADSVGRANAGTISRIKRRPSVHDLARHRFACACAVAACCNFSSNTSRSIRWRWSGRVEPAGAAARPRREPCWRVPSTQRAGTCRRSSTAQSASRAPMTQPRPE